MSGPESTIGDPNPRVPPSLGQTTSFDHAAVSDGTQAQSSEELASASHQSLPQVPGFELIGEIGRGGMGIVYRALDLGIQRDVAVKILHDKYAPDSASAHRFMEEARITGQLQHPGIPAVYQVGKMDDGRPFLAMKLIKGRTLDELLKKLTSDHPNWLAVFESICQAVGYAHSRQVIHRDLKPANIMVGSFGEVQVMDWGLAKVLNTPPMREPGSQSVESSSTEIRSLRDSDTRAGSIMGTAAYMSPEQALGENDRVDQHSDVFSLGAILCTILTGKPPYVGKDFDSVLRAAIRCKTEEVKQRLDDSGAEKDLILMAKSCLHEDPAQRPSDGSAVAAEIARLRSEADEHAAETERQRLKSELQATEMRKRRKVQMALIVVMVIGAAISFFYAIRSEQHARRAQNNEQAANRNAKRADEEAIRATQAATSLAAELKESRRLLDLARLRTTQVEFTNNAVQHAQMSLENILPENRCLVWHYLNRQIKQGVVVFAGHAGNVLCATLSVDGSRLATGSSDCTAMLWDVRTGQKLLEFRKHSGPVTGVVLSADGNRLITGSTDKTARLWDVRTGRSLAEFKGHSESVTSVALSADGSRLATGSADKSARLWDVRSGQCLLEFTGHFDQVTGVAMSADASRLATSSSDATARLWDARNGKLMLEFKGHSDPITCVAINAEGSRLVTGSADMTACLWDTRTGGQLLEFKGHARTVTSVAQSADGSRLVTGSSDKTARLWDLHTGQCIHELKGHIEPVTSVAYSSDCSCLVTGSSDRTARLWNARAVHNELEVKGHNGTVTSVALSSDGSRLATGASDMTARLWETQTGQSIRQFNEHIRLVTSVCLSADGSYLATGSYDRTARICNPHSGRSLMIFRGRTDESNGRHWGIVGQGRPETDGHTREITAVFLSADGKLLVTGSLDKTARLWDTRTGQSLVQFKGHTREITSVCLSEDSTRVLTGSLDHSARLWDVRTGTTILEITGHTDTVRCVALSRDGSRAVTGSLDNTARLWDAQSGRQLVEFKGHTEPVTSVALDAGCRRLVTGSTDMTARVWDVNTGQSLLELKGHTGEVMSVAISANGNWIATGSEDKTARLWDARPLPTPGAIDDEERHKRLWKTRPDPDWHVEQRTKFETEKNAYAAALHRSFEQRARGVVAVDYNQFDKAYWHFVAAALLKPPVPKAVEIEPKK